MTEFQIYTLDANDCRISVCRDTKDFSNQQGRGKFQVTREKMLAALRVDGSLLLMCEVEYLPPGSKICIEQEKDDDLLEIKIDLNIRDALRDMWQMELFTDCIIQVGSSKISAHRCILGQHSPVFLRMFSQKSMVEAQNGIITITDSRPEYVRAMLEFIYTGSVDKVSLDKDAQGILAIADKYEVLPLKELCERFLASSINSKNITSLAVIADTYFAHTLKKACTKFISTNHKSIIRSQEWREFRNNRSMLANDLLESVLDEQQSASTEDLTSVQDGSGSSDFSGPSSSVAMVTSYYDNFNLNGSQNSAICYQGDATQSTSDDRVPVRKRPRRRQ